MVRAFRGAPPSHPLSRYVRCAPRIEGSTTSKGRNHVYGDFTSIRVQEPRQRRSMRTGSDRAHPVLRRRFSRATAAAGIPRTSAAAFYWSGESFLGMRLRRNDSRRKRRSGSCVQRHHGCAQEGEVRRRLPPDADMVEAEQAGRAWGACTLRSLIRIDRRPGQDQARATHLPRLESCAHFSALPRSASTDDGPVHHEARAPVARWTLDADVAAHRVRATSAATAHSTRHIQRDARAQCSLSTVSASRLAAALVNEATTDAQGNCSRRNPRIVRATMLWWIVIARADTRLFRRHPPSGLPRSLPQSDPGQWATRSRVQRLLIHRHSPAIGAA